MIEIMNNETLNTIDTTQSGGDSGERQENGVFR